MCRIMALRSSEPTPLAPWLESFSQRCRSSKEYQGDGWGVAWWTPDGWDRYRTETPIWEDAPPPIPDSTVFLVHARSAFRDDEVDVELNMPFLDGEVAFAFNGELRGVRLSVPGANGAMRLFELFNRFRASGEGNAEAALGRLDRVVMARSAYVRALNVVVADRTGLHVHTRFSEDPDYFTLHTATWAPPGSRAPVGVVSSEALDLVEGQPQWQPLPNGSTLSMPCLDAPSSPGADTASSEEVEPCSW